MLSMFVDERNIEASNKVTARADVQGVREQRQEEVGGHGSMHSWKEKEVGRKREAREAREARPG
jgi:hypothetical protein